MIYSKLKQLVNLPILCKYNKGFEKWQTKFGTKPWMAGRLKDFKGKATDEGNFEAAPIEKGVAIKDRKWETIPFDKNKWVSSYTWTFEKDGEEHRVDLTWTQNKSLIESLPEEIPEEGIMITPVIADKTIEFDVEGQPKVARFTPEQIEAAKKIDPEEQVEPEEVKIDDLPFSPSETSENYREEDFYVCPHHQTTGGYEPCCDCGGWEEDEEHRLCTENENSELEL